MAELKQCPFCGGVNTQIQPAQHWTGMRSVVISVTIAHWCERKDGQPQSYMQVKGKTETDAIAAWNHRV